MPSMTSEQLMAYLNKKIFPQSSPSSTTTVAMTKPALKMTKSTDEEGLNKTEKRYLAHLRMLKLPWIGVQNMTLKLGHDCRLTIDFNFINENGELEAHDTKARTKTGKILVEDDAQVKMAVAARLFPFIQFFIVTEDKGVWTKKPIKP